MNSKSSTSHSLHSGNNSSRLERPSKTSTPLSISRAPSASPSSSATSTSQHHPSLKYSSVPGLTIKPAMKLPPSSSGEKHRSSSRNNDLHYLSKPKGIAITTTTNSSHANSGGAGGGGSSGGSGSGGSNSKASSPAPNIFSSPLSLVSSSPSNNGSSDKANNGAGGNGGSGQGVINSGGVAGLPASILR